MLIRLYDVVDERLCYEKVRELRWAEGITCPHCSSSSYRRQGHYNSTIIVMNIVTATTVKAEVSIMMI